MNTAFHVCDLLNLFISGRFSVVRHTVMVRFLFIYVIGLCAHGKGGTGAVLRYTNFKEESPQLTVAYDFPIVIEHEYTFTCDLSNLFISGVSCRSYNSNGEIFYLCDLCLLFAH